MSIAAETIESFRRDGACVLRGIFIDWIDTLRAGVDRNLAAPGPDVKIYQGKNGAGRFVGDSARNCTRTASDAARQRTPATATAASPPSIAKTPAAATHRNRRAPSRRSPG